MQTRPPTKTHPYKVGPAFICSIYLISMIMILEGSILQIMATLLNGKTKGTFPWQ